MKIISVLFLLSIAALSCSVRAQENAKFFRSVPVTVSDRDGRYIAGLKREDFSVFEDGVQQKITFFSAYKEPIKLTLLLDTSKSTRDVIDKIRAAAKEFVSSLSADDECQLATFDSTVKIVSPFTSNRAAIKTALDRIEINNFGGTLLYDAVNRVVEDSFKGAQGRKVVVLLTDGNDFGSALTKEEFLSRLEESDVLIYTVFFKTAGSFAAPNAATKKAKKKTRKKKNAPMILNSAQNIYVQSDEEVAALERRDEAEATDALKKMSDATAGRFYQSGAEDLKKVFKNITGELTEQYRLGYNARGAGDNAAASREITVKVARPDVVVRTRGAIRSKQ